MVWGALNNLLSLASVISVCWVPVKEQWQSPHLQLLLIYKDRRRVSWRSTRVSLWNEGVILICLCDTFLKDFLSKNANVTSRLWLVVLVYLLWYSSSAFFQILLLWTPEDGFCSSKVLMCDFCAFKSDVLKATLATDAVIGAMVSFWIFLCSWSV